ncbi:YczE/YyaS/YitT family protein [Brevundimonas sp. FT23028]|uniref:membrane protein YczE n=1 Tax=Brevundimonas sp. FT23028 TaxID=3393748 RepID=UPI003B588285
MFLRRFTQLQLGLFLYGLSIALMVRAELGLNPWSVFHQGLSDVTGVSMGLVVNGVGLLVLLLWIPLRQKPGIGTICNVLLIGTVADLCLRVLPPLDALWLRSVFLIAGVLLNAVATGAYIGAGLGPGPRDGITTGLLRVTKWEVRWVRTGVEATVLALGWLMGGTVGVGTVLFVATTGPLLQIFLPMFTRPEVPVRTPGPVASSS